MPTKHARPLCARWLCPIQLLRLGKRPLLLMIAEKLACVCV